jgi:rhodanese-related sulfurtransferase
MGVFDAVCSMQSVRCSCCGVSSEYHEIDFVLNWAWQSQASPADLVTHANFAVWTIFAYRTSLLGDISGKRLPQHIELVMSTRSNDLPGEVDVHFVKSLIDQGEDFLLLDCRENDEYDLVRIEGSRLLPMSELMARVDELRDHIDRRIVVLCHIGGRSQRVTQWLRQQGYSRAQNMTGGIDAWAIEVDPQLARY